MLNNQVRDDYIVLESGDKPPRDYDDKVFQHKEQ